MARLESPSTAVSRERNQTDADFTVVWVRGEHDIATNVSLTAMIGHAARLADAAVVIDLSGVTFMDASTLGVIIGCANRLRSRPQSLELRAPSLPALRLLELCGVTHLVHTAAAPGAPHPTGAAALGTWVEIPSTEPDEVIDSGPDHVLAPQPLSDAIDAVAAGRPLDAAVTVEADRGGP